MAYSDSQDRSPDAEKYAELAERIGAGDGAAEQQFCTMFQRWIRVLLLSWCHEPDLAAELAQDAMLVVLLRLRDRAIERPASVRAYLRNTAQNLLIAHRRKERTRRTDTDSDRVEHTPGSDDPFANRSRQEICEAVREAVDSLPVERDRLLLHRLYLLGESKASICRDLELTPSHFDRVIHRARQRLRQYLPPL